MFFFYFVDFILVCIIELGVVVRLKLEFDKCGVKVIVLSVDDVEFYKGWVGDINEI